MCAAYGSEGYFSPRGKPTTIEVIRDEGCVDFDEPLSRALLRLSAACVGRLNLSRSDSLILALSGALARRPYHQS